MRYFFLIITLAVAGCNSNQQSTKEAKAENKADKCFVYPKMIDSLQIKDLYDSARWYVYTWHCDPKYFPKSDTSRSITFGELPLKFDNLAFLHDTLLLNFNFTDMQETILPSMSRDNKELATGVGFDMKSRKKVYMLFPKGNITIKGGANRYENPLQPEVLTYIKNNWDKLDDCFRKLAGKNGIKQ